MKILYVHQYFKTPAEGGSIRSYYLAKGLVARGHGVTMITAWNEHYYHHAEIDGITVHYLPVFYKNELSPLFRIFAFMKFFFLSVRLILKKRSFEKAYIMTTPLSTGLQALFIKYLLSKPYIFEVGDLWPDVPIEMGYVKNSLLKTVLYGFEKLCYSKAEAVVALSPDIANAVEKKSPETPVHVIPNVADIHYFSPALTPFDQDKGSFTITYFGTAGVANHLEFLVSFAQKCFDDGLKVNFYIMASGARLEAIKSLSKPLENITFLPWGSKKEVKEILKITDAVYLSFDQHASLATGSPNKFFDGLAAGKIIITNFQGWIKDDIESSKCGFYYHPENPNEGVLKLKSLASKMETVKIYKANARELSKKYSLDTAIQKINDVISSPTR